MAGTFTQLLAIRVGVAIGEVLGAFHLPSRSSPTTLAVPSGHVRLPFMGSVDRLSAVVGYFPAR